MGSEQHENDMPPGIPFYVEDSPRKVPDPACPDTIEEWEGANEVTFKLLEALESLRDLRVVLNDLLAQDDPASDRRRIKGLSTPLYSFAWAIRNICTELIDNAESYGGLSDELKDKVSACRDQMVRVVPLSGSSPLRTVRNKIDAHVDPCVVADPEQIWHHVNLRQYIPWLGCSLTNFARLLSLDVYGWTCDADRPDIFRLMSVDGTMVDLLMVDGKPTTFLGITQTASPKISIAEEVNAVITMHNNLLTLLPAASEE